MGGTRKKVTEPVEGYLTQDFYTPVDYMADRDTHQANDYVTQGYKEIKAPYKGKVIHKVDRFTENKTTGFGNEIWISKEVNGKKYVDRFTHLKRGNHVQIGQKINKGDVIGFTGRTGFRNPRNVIHTHHERLIDGVRVDPSDPNTLPPQERPTKKRMLEKKYELVYVDNGNKKKDLWVLERGKNIRLKVKHKQHAALTQVMFTTRRKVEWAEIASMKEYSWKPNLIARTHPELFNLVIE